MELIHKKDGRLHIYVRQDTYKGELKSKNYVGRIYLNGKQMVKSSGTTVLEEAIPILEKWFDEVHAQNQNNNDLKVGEKEISKENIQIEKTSSENKPEQQTVITNAPYSRQENTNNTQNLVNADTNNFAIDKPEDPNQNFKNENENPVEKNKKIVSSKGIKESFFTKIKNIKLSDLKIKSKNVSGSQTQDKKNTKGSEKIKSLFKDIFQSRVSKLSVAGEEIAGLDITREAIRVCQVTGNKEKGWLLDKFSYRSLDPEKVPEKIFEAKDYLASEIELAMANGKITSKNVAVSIPYTSAIISVVTSPLMSEEELKKAIETDSLWENLVNLENLNDYSIFHQVINRNSKTNTMEILFVASKLSELSSYSSIVKKAGLNPVIVDVRCFTLKNAHDNTLYKNKEDATINSTILEVGLDENYLMIIHDNTPRITDVFLRQPEKDLLKGIKENQSSNEHDAVVRRYSMQIKQALNEYESKYDTKVTSVQVVSSLPNIESLIPKFRRNLQTVNFKIFDPLEGVSIPSYNEEKVNLANRSTIASVLGLAYRKLDVFGYYKFVTAVKNINLLPNREAIRQSAKFKFLSGYALKGVGIAIAVFYVLLIGFSYWTISSNKSKLVEFDAIQSQFDTTSSEFNKLNRQYTDMQQSLELGQLVSSNQSSSYRALAQIARSVPLRVEFTRMTFDGKNNVVISGKAFSDQDILNFINNLNAKSLVEEASLANMKQDSGQGNQTGGNKKGFEINCVIKG